jgi:hypothetical protein
VKLIVQESAIIKVVVFSLLIVYCIILYGTVAALFPFVARHKPGTENVPEPVWLVTKNTVIS